MAGEIVAGVAQGVAQAATMAIAEAPIAAVASVGTVAASIPQVAVVAAETAASVTQGLESVATLPSIGETFHGVSGATFFASQLSAIAQDGGSHKALTMLAFGNTPNGTMADMATHLPENILRQDFITLEKMAPEAVQGLTKEIAGMQLAKDLVDNPEFLSAFAEEFGKDVAAQKALMKEGKLTAEDYMAMRQSMLERSAGRASGQTKEEKDPAVNEKELERIKREAALSAIRQQMNLWRLSVKADKRLMPDAKQNALRRIDVFEHKVLLKEITKWDGVSVMTLLALATVWMQEVSS